MPNQLARRTAVTLPLPGGQRFFFAISACSGRRSRPAVQPVTAVIGRHAAGENVCRTIPPRGEVPALTACRQKQGGANTSVTNARKTAARTADEGPFGVAAERHPQPGAHKAAAIVRRAAREHGERAGL